MLRFFSATVLMIFLLLQGAGELRAEMRSLPLVHTSPEELAPVVRELFGSEVKVSALRNELIVRGPAAELAEVEGIVEKLDVAREILRVSIRQTARRADTGTHIDASGHLSGDRAGSAAADQPAGENVQGDIDEGGISVARRLGNASDIHDQFVHVLAGDLALLTVGKEVPYSDEIAVFVDRYGGQGFAQSVDFQTVATGFAVRPMLQNGRVLLEVAPFLRDFGRGDAAVGGAQPMVFQEAMTRLVVPLGQWVDLAGHLQRESDIGKSFVRYGTRSGEAWRQILIKVNKVRSFSGMGKE